MIWTEKCARNEVGKMRVRRRDTRIWFFALGTFAAVFLFTFLTQSFKKIDNEVGAASLVNFDPGYIISDYQMGNYNSMSEAEIQAFLTAKNSCGNTNYEYYLALSNSSAATWHFENGHFVCLSEELFGDGEVIGSGETAAHIIWQTAQDYKINPQVLLVLLQKETGLITDPIPNNYDYRKATGYGCPDTAPCSSQYYGFKNQVRKAAALFRTVLDGGWTNYPLGENYVQYNPNAACGGSVINIRSLATSALYRYTPYQPNEGALAAGYGTAYCGAYGNRNFYLYFEDWFGGITSDGVVFDDVDYSGIYNIVYAGGHTRAITVNDNNIEVRVYENADDTQWKVEKADDYYTITNVATGKVLAVYNGTFENKTNVEQFGQEQSCAQQWNFIQNKDGTVAIHNACYAKYVLDLADGNTNVQIYKKTEYENDHQKWILQPSGYVDMVDGTYNIYTADLDKVIGVDQNLIATGANILAGKFVNLDGSRIWKVTRVNGENYYMIENVTSGKMLGVVKKNIRNKTNVELCEKGEECAYYWYFEKYDDGYYIRNVYAVVQALDLADGDTNVQVYREIGGNTHQKWNLRLIDDKDLSGQYNIIYAGNRAKALSLTGEVSQNTANAIVDWLGSGASVLYWDVKKVDDYYVIMNAATGKVLDVSGGVFANRTNIQQYEMNQSCAQRWLFAENSDGTIVIHNACYPTYVLDVHNGDKNVQLYSKTSYENDHQKWVLNAADRRDYSGTYQILYGGDRTRMVSVENNIPEARVNVIVNDIDNGATKWLVRKENDYYVIENVATGKVLDLSGGAFSNKANIWQYNANGTCAQKWNIVANEDETVTIYSACYPQFVLDLADGRTNVQVYSKTSYENDHQKWEIKKLD